MAKLKCWKKDKSEENWKSKYARQSLFRSKNKVISVNLYEGFKKKNDTYNVDLIKNRSTKQLGSFKNKFSALKFANKYMKNHNQC